MDRSSHNPSSESRVRAQRWTWIVPNDTPSDRLDRYLSSQLTDLSRSAIQRLIADGHVTIDGQFTRASQKVAVGDAIQVLVPPPQPVSLVPEDRPLDILHEDADIVVLDKPPGEVVHPGPGHQSGTLVHALLAHCGDFTGVGGKMRPGIVHRLDKDTSGVLLVAKNDQAFRNLQEQFLRRQVRKEYLALVHGMVRDRKGRVEAPIGRDPGDRKRMAIVSGGKAAVTRYRVLKYLRETSVVKILLVTGRTHQIRVHFSFLGHPVVGDETYGNRLAASLAPRQFLHAWRIAVLHPTSGERIQFCSKLPADLREVLHQQARASTV